MVQRAACRFGHEPILSCRVPDPLQTRWDLAQICAALPTRLLGLNQNTLKISGDTILKAAWMRIGIFIVVSPRQPVDCKGLCEHF